MYTHYLFGALKINNPFKKYITYVQICQFYLCVGHATVTTLGLYERIFPRMLAVLQLGYHITMIYLFTNFLRTSYKDKKASEKAKKSS
jgi:elongation of very long chain fatty acids protein 4